MTTAKAKPKTIDEYLAGAGAVHRSALQKLRKTIRATAPKSEECISYGLAAFRLNGHPLVALGAWANHCAFYPMSARTLKSFELELKHFQTSKGTIRFTADKPLPAAIVRRLVKARISENTIRYGSRRKLKPQKPARIAAPDKPSKAFQTCVTATLSVRNWARAMDFYKATFGATELYRVPGGGVGQICVSGAEFWVAEESPDHLNFSPESLGGCSVRLLLVTNDPSAMYERAIRAGATEVAPVAEGHCWRLGRIVDPFGHHWEIGKPLG